MLVAHSLKRLARFRSEVSDYDDLLEVRVFDDELADDESDDTLVMWLDAAVSDDSIYVEEVNTIDRNYFRLPESRRDKAATVLFRAFIDHYNKHYGRDSDDWLPVHADFANYRLQEKFKQAVEKGIFPPESLERSRFTSADEWRGDDRWNIDLRRQEYERFNEFITAIHQEPTPYYPSLNVQDRFAVNNTYAELTHAFDKLMNEHPFLVRRIEYPNDPHTITYGTIINGNVYFGLPFVYDRDDFRNLAGARFFIGTGHEIDFNVPMEVIVQNVVPNLDNVRRAFEGVDDPRVEIPDRGDYVSFDELIDEIKSQTAPKTARRRTNAKRRLKRLAKLQSTVDKYYNKIFVKVYDDELDDETPIMWLYAIIRTTNRIPTAIYVTVVDFNDNLFFRLSESRRDRCALALFRAFINYYQEHYGRDSGNWLPVHADFVNYKLQEKFKQAVEKGIFPPESLELSSFTTEDKWQQEEHYRMDPRETYFKNQEQFQNLVTMMNLDPVAYYPTLNVQGRFAVNDTLVTYNQAVNALLTEYPFMTDTGLARVDNTLDTVGGAIVNGNVYFCLPFVSDVTDAVGLGGVQFEIYSKYGYIIFNGDISAVIDQIAADPANVRRVFANVGDLRVTNGDGLDLNGLIERAESGETIQRTTT